MHPSMKYSILHLNLHSKKLPNLVHTMLSGSLLLRSIVDKVINFSKKTSYSGHSKSPALPTIQHPNRILIHSLFYQYKIFFDYNQIPLVGGTPSIYSTDLKPIRDWKLLNIFLENGDIDKSSISVRPRKRKATYRNYRLNSRRRYILRLIKSSRSNSVKHLTWVDSIYNLSFTTKLNSKFKVLLKRSLLPTTITKLQTSQPLLFTGNALENKELKTPIDDTLNTFLQLRINRKSSRYKKLTFRRLKKNVKSQNTLKPTNHVHNRTLNLFLDTKLHLRTRLLFKKTSKHLFNNRYTLAPQKLTKLSEKIKKHTQTRMWSFSNKVLLCNIKRIKKYSKRRLEIQKKRNKQGVIRKSKKSPHPKSLKHFKSFYAKVVSKHCNKFNNPFYPHLNTSRNKIVSSGVFFDGSVKCKPLSTISNYIIQTQPSSKISPKGKSLLPPALNKFLANVNNKVYNLLHLMKLRFKGNCNKKLVLNRFDIQIDNPVIKPRTGKNFIFKNFGMFLASFNLSNQYNPFTYKFLFKKKIFSFVFPNEVRNSLMNRKKRITFYKLVYKLKHSPKTSYYHSLASFNKFVLHHYKNSLINKSNSYALTNKLFLNPNTSSSFLPTAFNYKDYLISKDEILYNENFKYRGLDLSFRTAEVKIPRVRFRPGYQRLWRRARTALKESMGLKFVYQQQLTRHLVAFYKGSTKYNFSRSEMSLNRMIMYSRLLPDMPTINIFLDQKLIYLNGKSVSEVMTILVPNDLIQLTISMWYYISFRWISNWTLKRHKKFKKLVYRKGLAGKHKVMKLKKQRSYYTPNWIYLARYDISDVKSFLEVDYFTLSAFVLYEPFLLQYYSPDDAPDYRPNIYRMYNWKYIT